MKRRTERQARSVLRARLETRRAEIEEAVLNRIGAIGDAGAGDSTYEEGLRDSVGAAVDYALEGIERAWEQGPPTPIALLAQARLAARNGIALDTILRRYFAGYSLLGFYLLEEAGRDGLMDSTELRRLIAAQAARFDRLLAAVGEEHAREVEASRLSSASGRRAERIERLLAGEPVDTTQIAYDFDIWHLGVLVAGAGAEQAIRQLAATVDCSLLLLRREDEVVWAWFGTRRPLDPTDVLRALATAGGDADGAVEAGDREGGEAVEVRTGAATAVGEPAEGLSGWRLTHRQAVAALPVARCDPGRRVRYADVALLALALRDDLLATSLRQLYIEPLEDGRDGGFVLRRTLRAYLDCERNSASAAATLGVTRQTVNYRLRLLEERIGRPLKTCLTEIEVALRLPER